MRSPPAAGDREGMEHTFPVRVEWSAGRQVVAGVPGKPSLRVGAPPEFDPDADPAVWSPEDLFCSAVATCLAVTITVQARKRNVPLVVLTVTAARTTGRRTDGRYGFTSLDLDVALT